MTQPSVQESDSYKPTIIGLYGLPGAGRSTLLGKLRELLQDADYTFFEGSDELVSVVPGGIDAFRNLPRDQQDLYRTQAIQRIHEECAKNRRTGVVTGHFSFWDEDDAVDDNIWTSADASIYTRILYLDVSAEEIQARCEEDTERARQKLSLSSIQAWLVSQKTKLEHHCRAGGISFHKVSPATVSTIIDLIIPDFHQRGEGEDSALAQIDVDKAVPPGAETMLVLYADKTPAAADGGALFWEHIEGRKDALDELFTRAGYSRASFREATRLHEEAAGQEDYDRFCQSAADKITTHPEMVNLIKHALARKDQIGIVVVTCGLRRIWEKVLQKGDLDVPVIGGMRVADKYVITADVKRHLVRRLQKHHRNTVYAIGDSKLDLDMLKQADHAVVAVCEVGIRSSSMDRVLEDAINNDGLLTQQVLLGTGTPRLTSAKLPIMQFDQAFFDKLTHRQVTTWHFSDSSASQILCAPTRNKKVFGLALRDAHHRAGYYLAIHHVSSLLGTEPYDMLDVRNKPTKGYRAKDEATTATIPLMRDGESMAYGVAQAFPLAHFFHAKEPQELVLEGGPPRSKIDSCTTIILVDWVINSGGSIIEFVRYLRFKLESQVPIIVVAGVMQQEARGELERALAGWGKVDVDALRISPNKYPGKGGKDTGHRLFNTTNLDELRV